MGEDKAQQVLDIDDSILESLSVDESMGHENAFSSSTGKPSRTHSNPHLIALGELEFRKAFLILSYCGRSRLEVAITVDMILRMKNMSMIQCESELWSVVGRNYIEQTDRCKNLDWDSERTYIYRCCVDTDGTYIFKGPYLQSQKTHLQRVLGDDNVLDVRFSEGEVSRNSSANSSEASVYHKIAKEGIFVGLRLYRFFGKAINFFF
ncbi:hypothetical protein GIB67_023248 [Kingdonia uniflora]|uniref:RDRP helical domain-containing protein n=1 Tax=Kingdonia uniflora TaxID=39325 RepID=A0A7J7LJC6_9MAGN|nr:hypothetical protein GIB67_023248 [Kingdonia uniflora]